MFNRRTWPPLVVAAGATAVALLATPASAVVVPNPVTLSAPDAEISLAPLGSHDTGVFDEGAAEIVEYYAKAKRLLKVNAAAGEVEVLDVRNPAAPTRLFAVTTAGITAADGSVIPAGASANSVAVRKDGLGVIAVQSDDKTDLGWLVFFDANGSGAALGAVRVGALPDMVTITEDGEYAVVANEGEPAEDYSVDPEGSISIVSIPRKIGAAVPQSAVRAAGFHAFEGNKLPAGIRIFGGRADAGTGTPAFPVSENLEPEYITIDRRSKKAYVTLQEANGMAVVDLKKATVEKIWSFGTVDRSVVPFDASDRDSAVNIRTWPVKAFRLPDSVAQFEVGGDIYLITADEGDTRDWDGYSEVARVKDLGSGGRKPICASVATAAGMTLAQLRSDANLGRLNITLAQGLSADGSCYETLYTHGSRGFSIWTADGQLVSYSGDKFEKLIAQALPTYFNSNHTEVAFDGRSDDKGPEPEGVAIGKVRHHLYAFIGLERVGGVMVFDVSDPAAPTFVTYVNNRDFATNAGDLGPEGLHFIDNSDSPTGEPMLAVGNEVSGSTTLFAINH
ncbi:choice-of-anchor I family protein [Frankia sp. CNm7]|uniref:Choice-of-anchor I family protein n=1 Tax=Frankia nepalensis TaxID=1836974 RepID=A0A937RMX1_9ACTN|nr:choice-of-anchor I family protein [Frankia nepalensis]MBL7497829.1 choice-of-anchor I family protein [Frankia nepalensis]MBL7515886.1 choice-of-anchor I family protein [Frankia nepalensis]MBL7523477.1 choice-of-anchor I family protein [Frankia nepalensis]MBL7631729.1 choice-of-anchor I family protein [Frankia nepalensis]